MQQFPDIVAAFSRYLKPLLPDGPQSTSIKRGRPGCSKKTLALYHSTRLRMSVCALASWPTMQG